MLRVPNMKAHENSQTVTKSYKFSKSFNVNLI